MDFFKYASIVSEFGVYDWIRYLVGGLCFAIVFVFQGIALFTIASREGYRHKWMAFVPFLNTLYIGVCAQKNKFYNISAKSIGIAAAVFEFVLFSLFVVYYVACELILNSGIAPVKEVGAFDTVTYYYDLDVVRGINGGLVWAAWMYNYMGIILYVLQLLYSFMLVVLLICFFQTYACNRYIVFVIASIFFPIQGILFFVVRNNKAMNYREYMRAVQERQYRMYQQYYQQNYNNPYNRNPYNRDPDRGAPPSGGTAQNPFDDFGSGGTNGGSGGSPFDDFE